jgi:streptomycin 6-kinase
MLSDHRFASSLTVHGNAANHAARPSRSNASASFRGRTLPSTAARHVLLCTDLHAGNVLAAEREPWLLIDPKPHVGDPTYDVLQHILNCDDRLRADPRALARRMANLLDLDLDRVLRWLFARCVQESPDSAHLAETARRIAPP